MYKMRKKICEMRGFNDSHFAHHSIRGCDTVQFGKKNTGVSKGNAVAAPLTAATVAHVSNTQWHSSPCDKQ
jgi:hypothetical protein